MKKKAKGRKIKSGAKKDRNKKYDCDVQSIRDLAEIREDILNISSNDNCGETDVGVPSIGKKYSSSVPNEKIESINSEENTEMTKSDNCTSSPCFLKEKILVIHGKLKKECLILYMLR